MRLYDDPHSGNGYKVRVSAGAPRDPYEYVAMDILKGETRTPAFLQKI